MVGNPLSCERYCGTTERYRGGYLQGAELRNGYPHAACWWQRLPGKQSSACRGFVEVGGLMRELSWKHLLDIVDQQVVITAAYLIFLFRLVPDWERVLADQGNCGTAPSQIVINLSHSLRDLPVSFVLTVSALFVIEILVYRMLEYKIHFAWAARIWKLTTTAFLVAGLVLSIIAIPLAMVNGLR